MRFFYYAFELTAEMFEKLKFYGNNFVCLRPQYYLIFTCGNLISNNFDSKLMSMLCSIDSAYRA